MPVRVGADKSLVSGEMLGAELLAQLLRPINGQAVVRAVPWVKADDLSLIHISIPKDHNASFSKSGVPFIKYFFT